MAASPEPGHDSGRERRYAEWFAWARQHLGADSLAAHEAAEAALEAARSGQDDQLAAAAASRAARGSTRLAALNVPARRRTYAEWYDWARTATGQTSEQLHVAAAAALRAMEAGLGPSVAAGEARAALGLPAPGPGGLAFWKSPLRVAILMFFCGTGPIFLFIPTVGIYWSWWHWHLFKFEHQEGLPRARNFWLSVIPLYGYVVLYQELRALAVAEAAVGVRPLQPLLGLGLVCVAAAANGLGNVFSSGPVLLGVFLAGAGILAVYASLVQTHVNSYLAAVHAGAGPAPLTIGEVIAAVLGGLAFALLLYALLAT